MAKPRLLLVGAGHAHLTVLRYLAGVPDVACDVTVVSPVDRHVYSGMVPGYLAGQYSFHAASVDVAAMTRAARATLVAGRAVRLDPRGKLVHLEDGSSLSYDIVSFNVGSRTTGDDDPGVREHALVVKPFERIRDMRERLRALSARSSAEAPRVIVVGAGAAGFEIACAADAVLAGGGHAGSVTLLEGGPRVLPGYSDRVVRIASRVLEQRRIALRLQQRVEKVETSGVLLATGERLEASLVLWLAGTTAVPMFQNCGLPLDERGYLLVDSQLRSTGSPSVFAVGDCATLVEYPQTPKAGVYAVRQTPVLMANIVATTRGLPPPATYVPQRDFLSLMNTCDGRALLRWKRIAAHARWCWHLKDRIDRRFMAGFRAGGGH